MKNPCKICARISDAKIMKIIIKLRKNGGQNPLKIHEKTMHKIITKNDAKIELKKREARTDP